jgi:uncharacterized protein (UPF0212 family)
MNKYLLILIILAGGLSIFSCQKEEEKIDPDISDTTDGYSHEELSDYSWDITSEIEITLNGTSITCNSPLVTVAGSSAVISGAGNYSISGQLIDGNITVEADTNSIIRLILNNADITNSRGPAILINKSKKTIINLADNSQNKLSDGTTYSDPTADPNAALFSKSDITVFGTGSLTITGRYKDGISGKDGLLIKSGTINISSSDDGLCGKDYLIIKGGDITINSTGDGMRSDDASNTAVGYILIETGNMAITSAADGITAQNTVTVKGGTINVTSGGGSSVSSGEISSKGIKGLEKVILDAGNVTVSSSDDALHSNKAIEINSGTYILSSASKALNADESVTINNGNISITKCEEGIESKFITVNDGVVIITSFDDSFNATAGSATEHDDQSVIYFNGGLTVLSGSNGDPLDSNGSIVMTSGTVIVHGPASAPEVGIDYNGTFNISGGLLVASGTNSNMTIPPSQSSTQNSIKLMFSSSHTSTTLFHIKDTEGNEVVTFQPERRYQSMILSSPLLVTGTTYKVYVSGSSTGTPGYGLFEGGIYTPGTEVASFTISNKVTSLNNL